MTQRAIEYDYIHDEWRCDLHDGHTVVVAKTLAEMEEALDVVENYQREQARVTSRPSAT
jgi:hypothetical protein